MRNSAVRALSVMAGFGHAHPESGIRISPAPFIDLLNSLVWTDRNKASLALLHLTDSRDPMLLDSLRTTAIPSLLDVVRRKSHGHAGAALIILGRIGRMTDEELGRAWNAWDTTGVLRAATTAGQ
ncbi:MAG: hypothetical protein ABI679_09530 [Gemmatimonadota bacterium]